MKDQEILEQYIAETFAGLDTALIDRDEIKRTLSFSVYLFCERLKNVVEAVVASSRNWIKK